MAGIRFTGVEIYRSNIAAQFTRVGQAGKWISALSYEMKLLAAAEAPKRSMELSRSHYTSFAVGTNGTRAIATIGNSAEHAEWVHEGTPKGAKTRTKGYIKGNPWLSIPAWGPYPALRRRSVSGQAANPWLDRACSQVSRSRGAFEVG